jgi:aminopeptidase-like protein
VRETGHELPTLLGEKIFGWLRDLYPICRSLTGPGVRQTLAYLHEILPGLTVHSVRSGSQAFDWTVPDEWTIREAWIEHEDGTRVVDFANHTLHVVGYSQPVDLWLDRSELQSNLYSLPEQPDAIPYVTSYYKPHWGFCLTDRQRQALKPGRYHVCIDSTLAPGEMNYGELILPGEQSEEILLSTYICHPSMANNELSGPVVTAALGSWLSGLSSRRYTYRIVFVPETIGAIVYISRNLKALKSRTIAGFVLTCMGDERAYSLVPSRLGGTLADRVARHVLHQVAPDYIQYSFLDRGSDERQYCSPGVDLPVCSIMRSKYGTYPEYHTSLDDLNFVSPRGLAQSYEVMRRCVEAIEHNDSFSATVLCEPQMGKRGLYSNISQRGSYDPDTRLLKDVLAYCDGNHDTIAIADRLGRSVSEVFRACQRLEVAGLVSK